MATHNRNQPIWADVEVPDAPELKRNLQTDVCVVGGGIAGLSTAYMLARDGHRVVLVDDGPIGGGQTLCTSAHLASAIDDRYFEIERLHGAEHARLAAASHATAIDEIENIVMAEGIDCDFQRVDGYLFAPPDSSSEVIEREYAAAGRTGAIQVSKARRAPLAFNTGPCLVFHRQGQFHPLKYLAGLAKAFAALGGRIYQAHAEQITGGRPALVEIVGGHSIECEAVVVATNSPFNDRYVIHTKQAPYMSYVVAAPVPVATVVHALYWDTDTPYHYARLQALDERHDLLIVGGEDHKTGQADDAPERFARLMTWARRRFPGVGRVRHRWAGQVMETFDGLAFIGRNPRDEENVFIATGDSGMGLTHGTIAGLLLTDLIAGRDNLWTKVYDPARKFTGSLRDFISENLNVAAQYVDLITPGEVSDVDEIEQNQGAIMRQGLRKIAVHCDDHRHLTACSAVCPHLGCVVAWNASEKTWDCPCHGSRFSPEGHVLNGPANSDLEPVNVPESAHARRH